MRVLSFDCGVVNLAWCVYDCSGDKHEILDWQVIDLSQLDSGKNPVCEVLINFLDQKSISEWLQTVHSPNPDRCHIVVEKQPFRNSAAKSIEACLYNYFVIRGRVDAERLGQRVVDRVCIFSATHKLAGEKVVRGKRAYRERKMKSIEIAARVSVVKDSPQWSRYLIDLPKKDDVCDALLQARAYVAQCSPSDGSRPTSLAKVIARKPKSGLLASDFTEANCKYVLKKWLYPRLRKERSKALELLPQKVEQDALLKKRIHEVFGDLNSAIRRLRL